MKKFIDRITPSFIKRYNDYLLKNAPLGWQLQLPTITWLWFLITLITLPLPFLYALDLRGKDDIQGIILVSVLTAVLEGGLFVYLLIQFNSTKSFGKRVVINGFKEQFAYLYVFMLCMVHIIFYPIIVDYRKGDVMSEKEIIQEAVTYNKAVHYFMGDEYHYRYFPSDSSFLHYMYIKKYPSYEYREASDEGYENKEEEYYIEQVKPLLQPYFLPDTELIAPQYTRVLKRCPKLYMIYDSYLNENYSDESNIRFYKDSLHYEKYQLQKKSDDERMDDIKKLIVLYTRYSESYNESSYYNDMIYFDSPKQILEKYKTNHFDWVMYNEDEVSRAVPVKIIDGEEVTRDIYAELNDYKISEVHSTIMGAKQNKWKHLFLRLMVCFHVAVAFSLLLFLFKNIRLKEFILMFVYPALLTLAVSILNVVLFRGKEHFPIHVIIAVFLVGVYFSFLNRRNKQFSSLKTIFILLTNLTLAYAPVFLFLYFHEYHDIGKIENADYYYPNYCGDHPEICAQHEFMLDVIMQSCLWGGIAFYFLIGSFLYKKVYERIWALPLKK
jgi:hypothetical protein